MTTQVVGKRSATPYMTVRDVLARLNSVSRRTFYHWLSIGTGPRFSKLPNGEIRVHPDDFDEWMSSLERSDR